MHEKKFRENIYRYCDDNVGKKLLSTAFTNFWRQSIQEISPQGLVNKTGGIIDDLVKERVLREVRKPHNFDDIPYGIYEILPHEKLIKDNKSKRFY